MKRANKVHRVKRESAANKDHEVKLVGLGYLAPKAIKATAEK